jgi:gluconolactonase
MRVSTRVRRRLRDIVRRTKLGIAAGRLVARSPRFLELFPPGARVERMASGFGFAEGPVWLAREHCLLISDIPGDRILRIDSERNVTVFREPSWNSNGLTLDHRGRVIACEHRTRRVSRTEADGSITTLAESFGDGRLNSPNDVVVKSDGAIYFTDPAAGIKAAEQEQSIQGVYRLHPGTNELTVVADDFVSPNGLAFSPDERRLFIDDSSVHRHHIRVFEVEADGTLSNGQIFASMEVGKPGPPDGMKIDSRGHVFCTGPGGVWVFDPQGEHLGTIVPPEPPANCAWGDHDWRSLYVTARSSVYRVRVVLPGLAVPGQRGPAGNGDQLE